MERQLVNKEINRTILLNPGPATTSARVKASLVQPDICPREKEFGVLLSEVLSGIKKVVNANEDYESVLISGPGTAAIESTLLHLAVEGKRILIVENGAYGKRMQDICEVYQVPYLKMDLPWDQVINVELLEEIIDQNPDISSVAFVHHETTSGLINPLDEISKLCLKKKVKLFVDAMSSYAGIEIDLSATPVDYLVSSSNKCIQGMAGFGFVVCQKSLLNLNRSRRSFTLDLEANYKSQVHKGEFLFTAPVQVLYAFNEALKEFFDEGIKQRADRYAKLYRTMREGMLELGFREIIKEQFHSKILTTFLEPTHTNYKFEDYHDYLFARGVTVYPGKIPALNCFRISNIGELEVKDIQYFLKLTAEYLKVSCVESLYP